MSKGVEPWLRSTSTYASKVDSFFVISFSLSSQFHSLVALAFLFFVLFSSSGTLPSFSLVLFSLDGALTFFFFVLFLLFEIWFCFLVFLDRVTLGGGLDFDEWSEVRLVTTASGDQSAARWVAAAGDWLEVHWVAGAGFGSSWPKVQVLSLFW